MGSVIRALLASGISTVYATLDGHAANRFEVRPSRAVTPKRVSNRPGHSDELLERGGDV